ncbi:acylneuraminate cytidylyltransferase [Maridesulfovibrio sp.]|uniref:PseG/SpsG family protein n=1 Tax=Maridesulfovibrio sp. TaxID=2795000 RepID=UPI002A188F65|nr:acylneuraminate cytidylyltransferase [Maridesulfovibrio sp.]
MKNSGPILFLCEAGPQTGFGHAGRCLAIASALRDKFGRDSIFGFRGASEAEDRINAAGFETIPVSDFDLWEFSNEGAVVLDLRIPLAYSFFQRSKTAEKLLVSIDDPTPNRLHTDLAFYPPVPQFNELGWDGFCGTIHRGWEFIPLRKEFRVPEKSQPIHSSPKILITMGGSDPHALTLKILQALKSVNGEWRAEIVIGPMFNNLDKIDQITVEHGKRVKLLHDIKDMSLPMLQADAAIASFGMTAYELAACGVPQLLLCLSEDHARSASALHASGAAVSLGKYDRISDRKLALELQNFISDQNSLESMAAKAAGLGIGQGAVNIASRIMNAI